MFAALNVYKPLEMSSHGVVSRLRRIFNFKKIGHLGTLDPLAEGVLPVCLGQATRLIEYFPTDKRYTAQITLGYTTTTLDREGSFTSEMDCSHLDISPERVSQVLKSLTGTIQQEVPLYSAVHVDGKRLYKTARQQEKQELSQQEPVPELPVREVTINALTLLERDDSNPAHPCLTVDVACSSGTYIRSLARDIGKALGCGAYLSSLVRTEHGAFRLHDSIHLEELQALEDPKAALLNPVDYLSIPNIALTAEWEARKLSNGIRIPVDSMLSNGLYLVTFSGKPIGVANASQGQLAPVKNFPPDSI